MDSGVLTSLLIVAALAVVVPVAMLFLGRMLGPFRPTETKCSVYECGIEPELDAKRRFSVKFFEPITITKKVVNQLHCINQATFQSKNVCHNFHFLQRRYRQRSKIVM